MNNQEIFNTVWNGLKSQSFKQSFMNHSLWGETCAYRGNNGLKCAAGWLLPDEEYDSEREGVGIADYPWFQEHFSLDQKILIAELQSLHDHTSDSELLEKKIRGFAKQNNLTIPE